MHYLKYRTLPDDCNETYLIRAQTSLYRLSLNQKLYRRSFPGPYLRYVHPKKLQEIIFKQHKGSYGGATLVADH